MRSGKCEASALLEIAVVVFHASLALPPSTFILLNTFCCLSLGFIFISHFRVSPHRSHSPCKMAFSFFSALILMSSHLFLCVPRPSCLSPPLVLMFPCQMAVNAQSLIHHRLAAEFRALPWFFYACVCHSGSSRRREPCSALDPVGGTSTYPCGCIVLHHRHVGESKVF